MRNVDGTASPLAFFGAELRRIRMEAGLSQEQLGQRIGCPSWFADWAERERTARSICWWEVARNLSGVVAVALRRLTAAGSA